MSEVATETAAPAASSAPVSQDVVIHVLFSNDGSVLEIGERPAPNAAQAWFNFLTEKAGESYHALSGGRGVFRLPRVTVDELKVAIAAAA